ncbi:hypothetical protein IFM47457_09104 [Aspergillus lentulus]|nr:hypothetical protein IFM47457_09104 [Aspergillus lentulus]
MIQQSADASQQQFVFVGGPVLKKEASRLRSTLVRQALAQKRSQRWQDAANKLDSMLASRREDKSIDQCTCRSTAAGEGLKKVYPDLLTTVDGSRLPVLINDPRNTDQRPRLLPAQLNCCLPCGRLQQPSPDGSHGQLRSYPNPTLLGAYRSNPFLPMDATAAKLKATELLDFAATTIWPHFRPVDYTGNGYRSWAFPMEDKMQLYAVLYAASCHRDVLRITYGAEEPILDSKERMEIRGLALRTLRMQVAKLSELTSPTTRLDGVIMCILYLAVHELHKGKMARDRSLFTPPFSRLQALDVYGGGIYHPLHWNTMQEIIQRSGGIEKIATARLIWLLSLSDLFGAFRVIRKPIYPMMTVAGRPLALERPGLLFQPHGYHDTSSILFSPGFGFQVLSSIWPPVKLDIAAVFIHLGEYSAVVQHYARTKCDDVVLDLLGDSRNLVHHRLLSLPDESGPCELIFELPDSHQTTDTESEQNKLSLLLSQQIYHTCRLSALLYALHVTFPIPHFRAPAQSILSALVPRIEWFRARNVSQPVLVWCLAVILSVLGENTPEFEGLVSYMVSMAREEAAVDSVPTLLAFLRSFAWVDAAVGDDWTNLWERIFHRGNTRFHHK